MSKKLILASASPYKKELLMRLGVPFESVDSKIDENFYKQKNKDPIKLTQILATKKAEVLLNEFQDAVIIGADQICFFQGKILGKTHSIEKSYEQLMEMQNREHSLITSFCILSGDKKVIRTNTTTLKMRSLSSSQVKNYLIRDNPIDCAGSYKLELRGIGLFEDIKTDDHTAIVGLPLISLANELINIGFEIPSGSN